MHEVLAPKLTVPILTMRGNDNGALRSYAEYHFGGKECSLYQICANSAGES
jgi:hypothetical protein